MCILHKLTVSCLLKGFMLDRIFFKLLFCAALYATLTQWKVFEQELRHLMRF